MENNFAVFSINPKQVDRFRDRYTVAGAKDDSRDARVLASALRTDRQSFKRVEADDPQARRGKAERETVSLMGRQRVRARRLDHWTWSADHAP